MIGGDASVFIARTLFRICAAFFLVYVLLTIAPEIEGRIAPPLRDFELGDVMLQGTDVLIVNSSVRKARNCSVVQPWRAQSINSKRMLQVIRDRTDAPNWEKGDEINVAPIIVIGGAGEPFRLFAEHRCSPGLWTVFSHLAIVEPPR